MHHRDRFSRSANHSFKVEVVFRGVILRHRKHINPKVRRNRVPFRHGLQGFEQISAGDTVPAAAEQGRRVRRPNIGEIFEVLVASQKKLMPEKIKAR